MSDIFISYARSTEAQARQIGEALRLLGYGVWRDDELPAHRAYSDVIEERLKAAKAVVVVWSAEAVKSHWVRAEADAAREAGTLVQLTVDGSGPPMPFNQIQCADLADWNGDTTAAGWRKVVASIGDLAAGAPAPTAEQTASQPTDKPSIAVMPFTNLSGDPEQEYFADGMVVEIAEALSRIRSLMVIAPSSTLAQKGKRVTPVEAGRQLGVRYVLEGTVRKAGNRVRIGVQLAAADDGSQLWSERFDDSMEDVFALQDRVAQHVAGVIAPEVREVEIRRARARPTENLRAYDLYLRAYADMRTIERSGVVEALALLDRALELDPEYGPALAAAAECHRFIAVYGWSEDSQSHERQALALARRAEAAAGDDADVLLAASLVLGYLGDPDDADRLAQRALALNPASGVALLFRAMELLRQGEAEAALEVLDGAERLDPVSRLGPIALLRAVACIQQRRFREAATALRGFVAKEESPVGHAFLAAVYGQLGEGALAREAMANFAARSTVPLEALSDRRARAWGVRAFYDEGIALAQAMAVAPNSPNPS